MALVVLVVALAAAGGLVGWNERGPLAAWGVPPLRRLVYGAAAGAALGLLLLPLLGLVAAVVLLAVSLAAVVAIGFAVVLLARVLGGRRG